MKPVTDPFHEGERRAQELAGEREAALHVGRALSERIIAGALPFVAAQPFVVVARRDPEGRPWASLLFGQPGFMRATPERLEIDLARGLHASDDPLREELSSVREVGLLVIEPATRRRLRVNGRLERVDSQRLAVRVEQAFPNCPQFITRRALIEDTTPRSDGPAERDLPGWAARTDTLFLASGHPDGPLDASHRGGAPGFVQVEPDGALLVPDYAGNGMFNSLGNLLLDPRAGVTLLDPARGRALELTGRVEILWEREQSAGTKRAWRFLPEARRTRTFPPGVRFSA